MNISEKEWISISFKPDIISKFVKIYPIKQKNKKIINVIFDKLHEQKTNLINSIYFVQLFDFRDIKKYNQ